jgi:hypothetical protein
MGNPGDESPDLRLETVAYPCRRRKDRGRHRPGAFASDVPAEGEGELKFWATRRPPAAARQTVGLPGFGCKSAVGSADIRVRASVESSNL